MVSDRAIKANETVPFLGKGSKRKKKGRTHIICLYEIPPGAKFCDLRREQRLGKAD